MVCVVSDGELIGRIGAKDYCAVVDAGNAGEFLRRVEAGECHSQGDLDALLHELSVRKGDGRGL